MNKNIIIAIIVIVAAAVIGYIVWFIQSSQAPTVPSGSNGYGVKINSSESAAKDTVSAVNSEIENIDVGDLNSEFKDIDAGLQSL
ncbi:hypothetical protein HZB06_01900 [Candidatus Wolfebacteria bacterium]|nr:hypothetical protein [Candidatus Wolfebacteria bacterium]